METGESVSCLLVNESSSSTTTTSLTKCPMPLPVSPQSSDPDPSLTIDDGEEDEDEVEQQPEQHLQPIQQLKNNLKGDGDGSLNSNGHHHYSDGYDSMAQPADGALPEDIDSNIDNNGGGGGGEFDLAQSETQKFVSNINCPPSSSSSLAEEPNNKINEDAGQPLSLSIKDGPSGSNMDSASDNGESDNGPGTDDNSKNESASSQPLNLMHSSPVSSAASDSSTGNIFSSTPTALSSTGSSSTTTTTPSSNIRHFKKALIYSSTNQQQQSNNDSIITGAASTNPRATSQFSPPLPMLPPASTVSPSSSLFKMPSGVAPSSSSSSSTNWNLKSSSSSKPNEAILQSLQASLLGPTSSSSNSTPSTLAVSPIPAEKKKLADFSIASITSSSMQTHSTPTQLPKHLSPSSSSSSSTSQEPPALSPIIPLHQLIQEQGRKVAEMLSKNNANNNNMAGTSSGDSNPTGLELEQLTQAAAMIDAIKSLNEYHQITQKQFQQQQQHQQQQQVLASNPMISEFLKQQQNALLAVTAAAAASGQGTSSGGGNSRYHHHHDSSAAGGSGSGNRNESAHLSKISHTDAEDNNQLAQQAGPSHQEQLQAHAAQDLLNLYQQHSKSSMKYFQMGSSGSGGGGGSSSSSSGRPGNKSGSLGGSGQVRGRPAGSGTKRKRLKSSDSASLELEQLQQQYQLIHHQDEDDDEDDLIQHKQLLAAAQSQQFSPNFFLNTTGNSSRASTSGGRSFGGDHHQISTDQVSSGGSFASPMPPMVTHVGRKPLNGPPCSLKTLVDDLILDPLDRSLTYEILGSKFVGDLLSNGFIRMSGTTQIFANPSSWANYCRSTIPSCSKDQKHYGSAWSIIRYLGKRLDSYKLRWYRKQRKQYVANVSASFGSPYGMSSMSHASTSSGPSSSNNSFASNLAGMLPQQQQHHSQKGGNSTIGSGGSSSSKLQNQNLESLLANFASSGMLKYPGTSGAGGSASCSSTAGTSTDASNSKASYASLLGSFNAAAAAAAAANNSAAMANLQNSTVASMQSSSSSISSQLPRNSIEMKSLVSFLNRDRLWKLDKISAGDSEFNSEFAHIVDENISLNDTNDSAIPVSSGSNGAAEGCSSDPDGAAIVPEKKVPAAPSATVSSNDASLSFNSIDLNSKQTNLDSNSKISCVPFSAIYCLQPFMVTISTNVLLLIDFHSHLISSEVSGYLAGIWDPRQQMLTISQAYPFRCKNVKDQQSQVLEIKQSIYQRGLQLVGWYHSHPNSVPHPTVADIRKQLSYQKKMLMAAGGGGGSTGTKPTGNGMNGNSSKLSSSSSNQQQQQQAMFDYSPCVGLIVSPFYQRNHTKKLATLSQMFWVMPLFANNNRDMGRPMQLSYNITRDAFLTQDLLVEMRMLATYFSAHDNFIKFSDHYRIDTSFWDKLQESLKSKLPKDLVEVHSQTVQNEIQQQALMHFWSFLKNLLLIA